MNDEENGKIKSLDSAIDLAIRFIGLNPKEVPVATVLEDLSDASPAVQKLYQRLGFLFECSQELNGYPPFQSGCYDIVMPPVRIEDLIFITSDSQNGYDICLTDNPDILYSRLAEEFDANEINYQTEPFLSEWVLNSLTFLWRWKSGLPEKLHGEILSSPDLVYLHKSDFWRQNFYIFEDWLLINQSYFGEKSYMDVNCFQPPRQLPLSLSSIDLEKCDRYDEEMFQAWEKLVEMKLKASA